LITPLGLIKRIAVSLFAASILVACSSTPSAPTPKAYPTLTKKAVTLDFSWQVSVGNGLGEKLLALEPAIGEQSVTLASEDGHVLLVSKETGEFVWQKKMPLNLVAGPTQGYGQIIIADQKGNVIALKEQDGREIWRMSLAATVISKPTITEHSVLVLLANGNLQALSRETGALLWLYQSNLPTLTLQKAASPVVVEDKVFLPTPNGRLLALDLESGRLLWDTIVATNQGRTELERMNDIAATPFVDAGNVYTVGYQSQLTAVNVEGKKRWVYDLSSVNSVSKLNRQLYISTIQGQILALDQESGQVIWKQPDYAWHNLSAVVVWKGYLAVADEKGYVHVLNPVDGSPVGRKRISSDSIVNLQVSGQQLFIWDEQGRLACYQ
jgi:outer membrane protein assembly factor BamB